MDRSGLVDQKLGLGLIGLVGSFQWVGYSPYGLFTLTRQLKKYHEMAAIVSLSNSLSSLLDIYVRVLTPQARSRNCSNLPVWQFTYLFAAKGHDNI